MVAGDGALRRNPGNWELPAGAWLPGDGEQATILSPDDYAPPTRAHLRVASCAKSDNRQRSAGGPSISFRAQAASHSHPAYGRVASQLRSTVRLPRQQGWRPHLIRTATSFIWLRLTQLRPPRNQMATTWVQHWAATVGGRLLFQIGKPCDQLIFRRQIKRGGASWRFRGLPTLPRRNPKWPKFEFGRTQVPASYPAVSENTSEEYRLKTADKTRPSAPPPPDDGPGRRY